MSVNTIHPEVVKLVSDTITQSNDLNFMADQVAHLLVGALGVKGVGIFIINTDTNELDVLSSSGLSVDYVHKGPILIDESIKPASKDEPVIVSDISKSSVLQYPEKARKEGINAIVSLPINVRGKIIGALRLYHGETWDVSTQDINNLQIICASVGMALMYFRLSTAVKMMKDTIDDIHSIWL